MASSSYLINSSVLSADFTAFKESGPYLLAGSVGYIVPIPWLCFFREEDFISHSIVITEYGEDFEEKIEMPCTSVKIAQSRLKASRWIFDNIVEDKKLGGLYWEHAIYFLNALPLPFLSLDPREVAYMGNPEIFINKLKMATNNTPESLPFILDVSGGNRDARPYTPDVFFSVPTKPNKARLEASIALFSHPLLEWCNYSGVSPIAPVMESPPGDSLYKIATDIGNLASTIDDRIYTSFYLNTFQSDRMIVVDKLVFSDGHIRYEKVEELEKPTEVEPETIGMSISAPNQQALDALLRNEEFQYKIRCIESERIVKICNQQGSLWSGYKFG